MLFRISRLFLFLFFILLCSIFTFYCYCNQICHLWQATQKKSAQTHTHKSHIHTHTCTLWSKTEVSIFTDWETGELMQFICSIIPFLLTFWSWLQLSSALYFITHAGVRTPRPLHTPVQLPICKLARSLHTVKPQDNPSWIMESHMTDK